MEFRQVSGDWNNPEGFAVFYTPVISEKGRYRSLTGFDTRKIVEESMRMISHWDVFEKHFDYVGGNATVFFDYFDNEDSLVKIVDGKEWDVYRSNEGEYSILDEEDSSDLDSILVDAFRQYIGNYFEKRVELTRENLGDSIPYDFNLEDVLPKWYKNR
tara:strand:+ start:569 stop:1042 length:474 start_codon:yes stop_codon:yes gene_type:complete